MTKIFYSAGNPLMSEHQDIIDHLNSEAISDVYCASLESMSAYVEEQGGIFFFPTNSISDLKALSQEESIRVNEAIQANATRIFRKEPNSTGKTSTRH